MGIKVFSGPVNLSLVIVILQALLVTFGQLELVQNFYVSNFLHSFLAIALVFYFLLSFNKISLVWFCLFCVLIFSAPLLVFSLEFDSFVEFSRISWFIVIALSLPYFVINTERLNSILVFSVYFYLLIGCVVIVDAAFYFIGFSFTIFQPYLYLTPRFSGPFYDSNFFGFIYGIFFLVSLYSGWNISLRLIIGAVSFLCVMLSGSFSALGLIFLSLLLGIVNKNTLQSVKFLFFLVVSFFILPSLYVLSDKYFDVVVLAVEMLGVFTQEQAIVKINSLIYRFESVYFASLAIAENPLGHGARSLLENLPRDPHNSYVGMMFEFGFFPLIAVFLSFSFRSGVYISGVIVTFVCCMGILLNVFYSPVYMLAVFYAYYFSRRGSIS